MHEIKDVRRRLAALRVAEVGAASRSPATSLADCRAAQSRLRELKREVLARIADVRTEVSEQARESLGSRPSSMREDWKRRRDEAKQLLAGVQKRVIGLVDGTHGNALEAWSEISEDIDARLEQLAELEPKLARAAGEDDSIYLGDRPETGGGGTADTSTGQNTVDDAVDDDLYAAAAARPPGRGNEADDEVDDDLYAAVGATVQKSGRAGAYCPHCGQGLEADDRFCRRCGHRLQKGANDD